MSKQTRFFSVALRAYKGYVEGRSIIDREFFMCRCGRDDYALTGLIAQREHILRTLVAREAALPEEERLFKPGALTNEVIVYEYQTYGWPQITRLPDDPDNPVFN